jgi:hypothetical protein
MEERDAWEIVESPVDSSAADAVTLPVKGVLGAVD